MLGMTPELSVAVGGVHVTDTDVVPLSAVSKIFEGQFEKVGPETSWNKKKHKNKLHTNNSRKCLYISEKRNITTRSLKLCQKIFNYLT